MQIFGVLCCLCSGWRSMDDEYDVLQSFGVVFTCLKLEVVRLIVYAHTYCSQRHATSCTSARAKEKKLFT